MAYEINLGNAISLQGNGDLSTLQFCFVTMDSTGMVSGAPAAGGAAIGVLGLPGTAAGRTCAVFTVPGTIARVKCGGLTVNGSPMMVGNDGKGVLWDGTKKVVAIALADGQDGDIIPALLVLQQ